MARVCEVCGKGPRVGNQVTLRGKAKYLGGVGTKVTGINRRQFKPNLQRVRVTVKGANQALLVCTQCLRSGAVTKRIQAAPFRLPADAGGKTKTDAAKKAVATK
jgi:large subunit ribosomal protein L28